MAAACGMLALFAVALTASPAQAARVGVLSNNYAAATAADFASKIAGHTFTGVDTSTSVPTLASLLGAYDVLLVFEDGRYRQFAGVSATLPPLSPTRVAQWSWARSTTRIAAM